LLVVIASTAVAKLGVLTLTIVLAMIAIVALHVQPVAPALVSKTVQLTCVSLLQLLAHLMFCFRTNFLEPMVLQAAISLTSLMD
jgi:hypothetical protein